MEQLRNNYLENAQLDDDRQVIAETITYLNALHALYSRSAVVSSASVTGPSPQITLQKSATILRLKHRPSLLSSLSSLQGLLSSYSSHISSQSSELSTLSQRLSSQSSLSSYLSSLSSRIEAVQLSSKDIEQERVLTKEELFDTVLREVQREIDAGWHEARKAEEMLEKELRSNAARNIDSRNDIKEKNKRTKVSEVATQVFIGEGGEEAVDDISNYFGNTNLFVAEGNVGSTEWASLLTADILGYKMRNDYLDHQQGYKINLTCLGDHIKH